jgi:uncharacterized protein (DUF608 family)
VCKIELTELNIKPRGILSLCGKNLRAAAMPIGGIGTGSIAMGADGFLKQWQITNSVRHLAFIPNSFFGIWIKNQKNSANPSITRALLCSNFRDDSDFIRPKSTNDHHLSIGARDMLNYLPTVEDIQFDGEYPISFLKFIDKKFPIEISLTVYNPFIPLDPKNSALPLIVFDFQIQNPTENSYEVSLIGNMLNFIGWDGTGVFKGCSYKHFGGNINNLKRIGDWQGIEMTSETVLKKDTRWGDISFAIDTSEPMISLQWDDLGTFWADFSKQGRFSPTKSNESSSLGKTWAGSLGSKVTLAPGESRNIKFMFAWNFPNRIVDWYAQQKNLFDNHTEFWIGNRYNEWFKKSSSIIEYFQKNMNYLIGKTKKFHDIFFSTTLAPEVLTSISAPLSSIRAPTCFWTREGNFHGFEGCHGSSTWLRSGGCCPLDSTIVWYYVFSIPHLFPTLERSMLETNFGLQKESGLLHHRKVIPEYLPQIQYGDLMPPGLDGMLGMVLRIYRDYLITTDREFLISTWPLIENLMEYIFREKDKEMKGIIESDQPNTYDCYECTLGGINTFIGSLYLATLLAGEKICMILDKPVWEKKFKQAYLSGRKILDETCWNGEYYIQKYDEKIYHNHQYGNGCHSDQLNGQWWAFELGLGYILPKEHIIKAVESIVKYNFKDSLEGIQQGRIFASAFESGLLNCTWPNNDPPKDPLIYYNEVWTGVEYEVASLCLYTDNVKNALKILQSVRKRYDGTRRNPWNEIECGDHYIRAMSSWTLLHAFTGFRYIREMFQFQLGPKTDSDMFTTFFITKNAWGQASQKTKEEKLSFKLSVAHGELKLKSIRMNSIGNLNIKTIHVYVDDIEQSGVSLIPNSSEVEVSFSKLIIIKEESHLLLELNG